MNAARQAFAQHGYAGASMREIAQAAAVTKPMIYYYFVSKEGLWRTVLEHAYARARARLEAAVRTTNVPRQQLVYLIEAHLDLVGESLHAMQLLTRPHGPLAPRYDVLLDALLQEILGDAKGRGELAEVDRQMFSMALHGTLAALPAHLPHSAEALVNLLWEGAAKR